MANLSDIFTAGSSNNLLEIIQAPADGRTFQGASNSYTLQNVTAYQATTTSYVDCTGSVINYIPPTGTKYIRYEYKTHISMSDAATGISGISHWRMYVDDTQITHAYKNFASNYNTPYGYANLPVTMTYVFDLTADTDDYATGKITGWTSAKEIKCMVRAYSTTYDGARLHWNVWRDGSGTSGDDVYTPPLLTVIAYS